MSGKRTNQITEMVPPVTVRSLQGNLTLQRERIAEAVHQAICRELGTGEPPLGLCWLYNAVGRLIAEKVSGQRYLLQAGALFVQPNPMTPERWFGFDDSNGGFDRGSYHVWFIHIDQPGGSPSRTREPAAGPRLEIIDFASREWQRWVAARGQQWARPLVPYLWVPVCDLPLWIRYKPGEQATAAVNHPPSDQAAQVQRLAGHALRLYRSARATDRDSRCM